MAAFSSLKIVLCLSACIMSNVSSFSCFGQPQVRVKSKPLNQCQAHQQRGVTFQYSPSSLKHLEAVELPDDSQSRPWTREKFQATAGALLLGTSAGALGEFAVQSLFGEKDAFVLFGTLGAAAGWYLCGGQQVRQQEMPMNGGYDAKLVADRPSRLRTILEDLNDNNEVKVETMSPDRDFSEALVYIRNVHGEEYVNQVEFKSRESDRPRRFNPLYARTLLDQNTYEAAIHAVADWIDSVNGALSDSPRFALVRPPSHHACQAKAMGGCFFNSVAIAAMYALDQPGVEHVAILDIDAHHGNGIAHCIQDEPRIRYCSIHEETSEFYIIDQKISPDDPRTADDSDRGPLGNICNINLPSRTGWNTGYQEALQEVALPFLLQDEPDLLIVAAGFDAMGSDFSSGFTLQPTDYEKLGAMLHEQFDNRVAFGLEGGYSWENHDLSFGLIELVRPWRA